VKVREAPYALRIVRRKEGQTAIVYRRRLSGGGDGEPSERLERVTALSPLAFTAGSRLLREGVRAAEGPGAKLSTGPFHALDADWGVRIACYAMVASGLKNAGGLGRAAENLRAADANEAAWWFGLMDNGKGQRAVRALRILLEAVA
jgi:hypothetical protein